MAWRKLTVADVMGMVETADYGIAVRIPWMRDTAYNAATIIGSERVGKDLYIRLARPIAYASVSNERQPHLYCEVLDMTLKSATQGDTALEVWQGRDHVAYHRVAGA